MVSRQPQVGDRYRNVESTFRNASWILTEVFAYRDGIAHGRLTSIHDTTQYKTLALSVIADPSRFTLVETPEAVPG